ncbi:MAG TPA: DUF4097 family beta strand repeat-containing protein [Candidatus Saccharimonadales bacterium]|nr:DUF4097 family beta strand repeat-containing protein [Candidatus Saccharimonadales bacterium]
MKKLSRIAIIAGVLLMLIGLIWSGFNLGRIRDDIDNIGQKHYTPLQASYDAAPVHTISTDLGDVAVNIATDAGSTHVTVDYFKTETEKFKVTDSNGTISVTRAGAEPNEFMCLFRCIGRPHTITIHVPADSGYAYYLTANNAPVSFKNNAKLQAQQIHVKSSNSTIFMGNIAAHGTITLRSDNGTIRLHDMAAEGTMTLNSSNGTNQLTRVTAPTIHATADNGGDTLETVSAQNLNVHASNATVTLHGLHADHSIITSDNGSVEGSLAGPKSDYNIKVWSSNGSIRLNGVSSNGSYFSDNDNAPKSFSATASNGRVDLTFDT